MSVLFDNSKLFRDIAQTKSMSRGAAHNGISQSAASQHIHELEKRLGISLLDRTTRPLTLTAAGKLITFEQGVRFLTDYLFGDTYYPVTRDSHNLDRSRTQFRLLESIEAQERPMEQVVRSAGMSAQLLAREGDYAQIRMPSGEVRRIAVICYATIGQIGNVEHENENVGKAGKSRWRGKRPAVRGVTMNPFDHPHGGGEGRSGPGGNPKTPWGKPALGYRTRRNKKTKNMLVRRRPPKRKSKG